MEKFDLEDDCYIIDLRKDQRAIDLKLTEKEFIRLYYYFHTNDIGPAHLPDKTYDCPEPFGDLTGKSILPKHFASSRTLTYLQIHKNPNSAKTSHSPSLPPQRSNTRLFKT